MRIFSFSFIFVILICCVLPSVSSADQGNIVAYGDIPFGISYKRTKSLLSNKFGKVDTTFSRDAEDGLRVSYRRGKDFYHFDYNFHKGKLVTCIITAPTNFIKNYFNKKYGKPTSTYPASVFCGTSLRSQGTYNVTNDVWERSQGTATLKFVCEHRTLTQLGIIEAK